MKKITLLDINMLGVIFMAVMVIISYNFFNPTQEDLEEQRIIERTVQELERLANDNLEDLEMQQGINERIVELKTKNVRVDEYDRTKIMAVMILWVIGTVGFFFGMVAENSEDLKTDEASFGAKFMSGVGFVFAAIFSCAIVILRLFG